MLKNVSGPRAATTISSSIVTIRSGVPMYHSSSAANAAGGGRSAGSPRGAPASTHATMAPISASVSERSLR